MASPGDLRWADACPIARRTHHRALQVAPHRPLYLSRHQRAVAGAPFACCPRACVNPALDDAPAAAGESLVALTPFRAGTRTRKLLFTAYFFHFLTSLSFTFFFTYSLFTITVLLVSFSTSLVYICPILFPVCLFSFHFCTIYWLLFRFY